ncbi:MAG TPA: hypothetical protein VFG44_03970 [Burkholderiales bacterium]|nr:hypothetical protein [Burkholderiales bacterium]
MGYWESLDEERIEQQRRLPWYKRDWFVANACLVGIAFFTFQFVVLFKLVERKFLSLF